MNLKKNPWQAVVLLVLAGLAAGAWADPPHRHFHRPRTVVEFGFHFGAPWGYGWYYPYGYWPRVYVPPVIAPVVVTPPQPPVYVEQPAVHPAVPTLEPGYWYYCDEVQAYYPYVKQCPGAWRKVVPRPPQ